VGIVNRGHDEPDLPRWLRLAAARRAEPAPDTLARVRARLVAGAAAPAWVAWLGRPVTVAAAAALLVASAWTGATLLGPAAGDGGQSFTLTDALLADDGSLGLAPPATEPGTSPDSQAVTP
jgi:hypothetical protein